MFSLITDIAYIAYTFKFIDAAGFGGCKVCYSYRSSSSLKIIYSVFYNFLVFFYFYNCDFDKFFGGFFISFVGYREEEGFSLLKFFF